MKEFDEHKIDEYLLGRLKGTELTEFKNQLAMDQNFSDQVRQRQEALRYIDVLGDLALKERVKKLHTEAVKNLPPEKRFNVISILKYAAVVVFIVAAGLWLLQGATSGADIYNDYYQAYDLNFGERGTPSEDIIAAAGRFYADRDYQNALEQFNSLPSTSISSKIILAQGISYLETNQYQKASTAFQQLIDQEDLIYEDHARWYLAMTYFKEGKEKEAKILIEQIADKSGSFNQQKAKDILNDL